MVFWERGMRVLSIVARVALGAVFLLGCSKKNEDPSAISVSQVVARLGDQTITIQELDNEFRLANIPSDKRKEVGTVKKVLGELIARKYLVRRALAEKLDREPTVLLDILRAREFVLANSTATREVDAKSAALTEADVRDYIAKNPLKFANRQLVTVEQITFRSGADLQAIVDATRDMKTIDEADQKLSSMGVSHSRSISALNSGDMPPSLFNQMQATRDGLVFIQSGPNGIFIKIKGQEDRPLEGMSAATLARQLLRLDLMKTETGLTITAANLEAKFEGEYAKIMASDAGPPTIEKDDASGRSIPGQ